MITAVLIGRENVSPFLRGIPPKIEEQLKIEVEALAIKLTRKVKEEKLSGQELKNRIGALRASINYKIQNGYRAFYGIVGTNKQYAAVHEYGFDGIVNVRSFLRMLVKAFGKQLLNPVQVTVGAHTRHMIMPERSFLRSSLREMKPEVLKRLAEAIRKGAQNAK